MAKIAVKFKRKKMDLKIYYDDWQMECCGDAFKLGDEISWYVAKFKTDTDFIFRDADYSYEAHGREEYNITGVVTEIWAIYFRYESCDELHGRVLRPVEYKTKEISRSHGFEPEFEGFTFGAYLVRLSDAIVCDLADEIYDKFARKSKFESKIVSPNQKDANGETILNLAVADADKYAVEMLLNKGADVNLAGYEGFTPIQRACFCDSEAIFELLLSEGADLDAINDAGTSARQYCEGKFEGVKNAARLRKIIAKYKWYATLRQKSN